MSGRSNKSQKGKGAPAYKKPEQVIHVKKRGGAAAVMDLSELTKGMEQKGSTYEDEYGIRLQEAMDKELRSTYKFMKNVESHWLPKTEQTVINEMISKARKIQRQIEGLED